MSCGCAECLILPCPWHHSSHMRKEVKVQFTKDTSGRAWTLRAARKWLTKLNIAEMRLKAAKAVLRTSKHELSGKKPLTKYRTKQIANFVGVALDAVRVAQADVDRKRDAFMSCIRQVLGQ